MIPWNLKNMVQEILVFFPVRKYAAKSQLLALF